MTAHTEIEPIHPNEILLIASRATLGHSVNPEQYERCRADHTMLMAESFNHPGKKDVLHRQYVRQQLFVRNFRHV